MLHSVQKQDLNEFCHNLVAINQLQPNWQVTSVEQPQRYERSFPITKYGQLAADRNGRFENSLPSTVGTAMV